MKKLPYELSMRLSFNNNSIRASLHKLKKAKSNADNQGVYTAIGELLLWVITTDEWHMKNGLNDYNNRKANDDGGKILLGMKHAFNCLKHNMDFFQIHRIESGFSFPMTFPIGFTVLWMPAGDILKGKYENQKMNYVKYLEGREVIKTFESAITFLNKEFTKIKFD